MVDFSLVKEAAAILESAVNVAVLTGAGVSAESGVPTFRASEGLWEGHRVEDVATPTGFQRDPELVWRFYNERRQNLRSVVPNPGHVALAKLEEKLGDNFTLITQNIDGLHQKAGSKNVLEIHGSIRKTLCTHCGLIAHAPIEMDLGDLPRCLDCSHLLRPKIVWFHEMLPIDIWETAQFAASEATAFLVVGTSAVVFPAASLIPIAKMTRSPGARIIEINLAATEVSSMCDISILGPSGVVLPLILKELGIEV